MKKTLIVLIMSIAISAQAFANQDIIVNHVKKTVTIQANFVSVAPITKSLNQAADLWNSKSGKYFCNIETKNGLEKYAINFKIVVNKNMENNLATNVVTILPNNHKLFKSTTSTDSKNNKIVKTTVCVTDGKVIGISEGYKNNKYVLAREMGHNLGLKQTKNLPCCHFGMNDLAIFGMKDMDVFEIKSSVTQLACISNTKDSTTRNRIELYAYNHDYGYESIARI